jgi:putative ABC transport system permease protein
MNRLLLFLIAHATPACDREYVLGDVAEQFEHVRTSAGPAAARAWLRSEAARVLRQAGGHRLAVRGRSIVTRVHGENAMSSFLQDVRHSCRALGRSRGFAAIAVATLGLGIGVNTAMFAVVNGVLLKRLPFAHVDRLMLVHLLSRDSASAPENEGVWSFPKFQAFVAAQQVYEDSGLFIGVPASLAGDEAAPEPIEMEVVTSSYHRTLGVRPILGRAFTPEETDAAGAQPLVILSHALWTRRFGSDSRVLGRAVPIDDVPHTIIGVLPPGFRGLTGTADIWVPLASRWPDSLTVWSWHSYYLVARRKAEVSEQAARASVAVLGAQIKSTETSSASPGSTTSASTRSLDASRADVDVRRASLMLLGAVGFVLLIACVNLTNLVATRTLARRRDVALRMAIGATRFRIVRQFAADGLMLGLGGAITGVVLSAFLLKASAWLLPEASVFFRTSIAPGVSRMSGTEGLTRIAASMVGLDLTTLVFAAGATALTALLIAVVPARRASSLQPADALRAGVRSATDRGFGALAARSGLVTVQVGLALVLLSGAGLMIRSAMRLHGTDIGIRPDRVVTLGISLPPRVYRGPKSVAFFDQLIERMRALPGVESVSVANCLPVSGGCSNTEMWKLPRRPDAPEGSPVGVFWAGPDYFPMLGIRLIAGRGFSRDDVTGRPRVVLISEAAARRLWPNTSPLGKTVGVGQGGFQDGAEIIGIVSDVRYRAIEEAPRPDVYLPVAQSPRTGLRLLVRAHDDAASLAPAITREVRALDASLALPAFKTLEAQIDDAMWRTRVAAWLLSALAALAALLTAIGIFGVMAQVVLQRTAEIGIRLALGAARRDVLSLVLGRAALITVAGLVAGTFAALALTRLISTFLYQTAPHDPVTFVSVACVLGVVALVASYIPARHATRVDAVIALRGE